MTLGGGTDVNKDPLLSIGLPEFAVDFYVFSDDRYVRVLTFTADVTVPVNLSDRRDPKTNPSGGLLPQIGTLGIANQAITNSALDHRRSDDGGLGALVDRQRARRAAPRQRLQPDQPVERALARSA